MFLVRFSSHALFQLHERGLTQAEVRVAVQKPDKRIQQSLHRYRAIRWIRKRKKRYLLIAIYDVSGTTAEVVTAFLTSKVKKYL